MIRFHNIPHFTDELAYVLRKSLSLRQQSITLAFIVGLIVGILAVAFKASIEILAHNIYNITSSPTVWYSYFYLPIIAALGGAVAGFIVWVVPQSSGSGIPEVRLQLARIGKKIPRRNIIAKFFGGIAAIGSGLSMGREGPTVTIGAGCGRLIGSIFKLTGKRENQLFAAGAGAGLAAAFNTPIAGVIFVVEELSHNFKASFLAPCIVASITASAVTRFFQGNNPSFVLDIKHESVPIESILVYIFVGIIAGLVGSLFTKSIMESLDFFDNIKKLPVWGKIAIAGLFTGTVGIFIPQALGNGHLATQAILNGNPEILATNILSLSGFTGSIFWILLIWLAAKILLTGIAYGSGAPGGIFAPALFCGAAMGLFLGQSMEIIPHLEWIEPTNVALVCMGAVFTAVVRTPITGIVIIFEMTTNYELILPLMLSCIFSDLVASKLYPKAIYPALLFRSTGIDIEADDFVHPMEQVKVQDVMTTSVDFLTKRTNIAEAFEAMERTHHNGFPIISRRNKLLGVITLSDLENAFLKSTPPETAIEYIMTKKLITITPEETLNIALDKMHAHKIGRLLVVDKFHRDKMVGIITRTDILKAEIDSV